MTFVSETARRQPAVSFNWLANLRNAFRLELKRQRVFRETYAELKSLDERDLADLGLSSLLLRDIARDAAMKVTL